MFLDGESSPASSQFSVRQEAFASNIFIQLLIKLWELSHCRTCAAESGRRHSQTWHGSFEAKTPLSHREYSTGYLPKVIVITQPSQESLTAALCSGEGLRNYASVNKYHLRNFTSTNLPISARWGHSQLSGDLQRPFPLKFSPGWDKVGDLQFQLLLN